MRPFDLYMAFGNLLILYMVSSLLSGFKIFRVFWCWSVFLPGAASKQKSQFLLLLGLGPSFEPPCHVGSEPESAEPKSAEPISSEPAPGGEGWKWVGVFVLLDFCHLSWTSEESTAFAWDE